MKVKLISHTMAPEATIAMAGKLCYSKASIEDLEKNLDYKEVEKFIEKLMSMGHESPLEHASFTFAIEGISRACSHQLVRHRIASYSQQSQRYVRLDPFEYIIPPRIKPGYALNIFKKYMEDAQNDYNVLVKTLMREGYSEKEAIEDARYVFPNACETKIIVTMNVRELHHFFEQRCCERAQWEIRELVTEMLRLCKLESPLLFRACGPKCVRGKCPEGNMSCGLSLEKRKLFLGEDNEE